MSTRLPLKRIDLLPAFAAFGFMSTGIGSAAFAASRSSDESGRLSAQWQVQGVFIAGHRTDRLLYQQDDPRLVGRILTISAGSVETNLPEGRACDQPHLIRDARTVDHLLLDSRLDGDNTDPLGDYNLPAQSRGNATLMWIGCATKQFGPEPEGLPNDRPQAATLPPPPPERDEKSRDGPATSHERVPKGASTWIALFPDGHALLRWYDQTLLRLGRVYPGAVPQPSFSCSAARIPAERSICASLQLAAFDRSVSSALAWARQQCDGEEACLSDLRKSQLHWLTGRNECRSDLPCLESSMRSRLDALMSGASGD